MNLFKSNPFSTNSRHSITFIENFANNRKDKNSSQDNDQQSITFVDNFTTSINDFDVFNETLFANVEKIRFRYKNDLLYYVNELNNERKKLYIFKKLVKKIFVLIHDRLNHVKYHKTHNKIIAFFYIRKLVKQLRIYVIHCFQC